MTETKEPHVLFDNHKKYTQVGWYRYVAAGGDDPDNYIYHPIPFYDYEHLSGDVFTILIHSNLYGFHWINASAAHIKPFYGGEFNA